MNEKLKWKDRALLALYGCLGVVVAVWAALGLPMCLENWFGLSGAAWPYVVAVVVALLLLAGAAQAIRLALRRDSSAEKGSVSVQNTENGAVRISVQAMDTLVKQAIGQADGIEEIKTSVVNHEDSISVNIDMTLRSDVHIPNVTMLMQRSIKNFIEEFSGIAVRDVAVLVSRIVETQPPQLSTIQAEPPKAVEAPKDQQVPEEEAQPQDGEAVYEEEAVYEAQPEDHEEAVQAADVDQAEEPVLEMAEGEAALEEAQPEGEDSFAYPEDQALEQDDEEKKSDEAAGQEKDVW